MLTQTLETVQDFTELPTEPTSNINSEAEMDLHYRIACASEIKSRFPSLISHIGRWILAATVATTPMTYYDPVLEQRKSGASSIIWTYRRKHGQPISVAEARQIALRIMEETEQRLNQERMSEAQFLLSFWEDEGEI